MKSSRRVLSVLALLLLLALAFSGCTGAGDGASTVFEGADEAAAPSGEENDINQVERHRLQEGGTLLWPLEGMPPNFNRHAVDGALGYTVAVMGALLLSPFDFDAAGRPIENEDLVESAELTTTEPQQVVTYRINPEAVWYDGTPITVADFEAQWRALRGTDTAFKVASTQGYDTIESVTAGNNDREVVVTFREDYADWRGLFSGLYPASTNRDPAVFNEGWREKTLTTAGPFRFENLDRTAQTITLVRNERWWGDPAKLDRIVYRVLSQDDAEIDALANGEIHFLDVGPDVNKLKRAQTTPGIELRRAAGPNYRQITLNGSSEVLGDVQVRRALALAIDRDIIVRALLGPLDIPAETLDNHIFMRNQRGYQDNSDELGAHDPERAEAILDEAGWQRAGAVRAKDGRELALRFVIPSQFAPSKQEAELVQSMLQRIGVRVNIEAVPSEDFVQYLIAGDFDLTVFSWYGTPFPISSSRSVYTQPLPDDRGDSNVSQNYARVGSAEIDRMFDQAIGEFDEAKAIDLANQIDALIWQVVHSLPLYQRPEIVATRADLANFGAFGFSNREYEDVGFIAS
ncbi:MAG TPA: ABC transporter family substrate-binding protein [Acidimicrobiales bacterium]|nr:ABC transporter family substrate-binding protein [Acidimicrobiales bacterium]